MPGGVRSFRQRPTSASLSHGNLLTVSSARNGGSSSSILSSATTSASSVADEEEGDVNERRRTKHVQWRRGKSDSARGRRLRTRTESSRGSDSEDEPRGVGRVSRSGSRAGSGVRTVYDRYNLSPRHSRPRSRLSGSVVSLADSEVSYLKDVLRGAFSLDELYIPPHDLKILERMALRVQMERERELKADRKRDLWLSQEKLAREERSRRIEEYRRRIADQWRREQEAIALRKMKIEQRRQLVTTKIRQEVDERHKHAHEQLERLRMSRQEQLKRQHEAYVARKVRLDWELRRREREELENKRKKLEESENRIRIAEECRRRAAELHQHRLAQAYQQSQDYNLVKRSEVLKKADTVLESVRRRMAEREEQAVANYKEVVSRRNEQLKLQSDDLRRKMDHVTTVRKQLNVGFEQWRRKVEDLQAASLDRAQSAVMQDLERKARFIREAEEKRKSGQELNKKRIDAQEAIEEQHRRRRLANKDKKSEMLKLEKERTIQDSRVIANTTASLRDRLRRSLSPDTFDKKAAMATTQLRFVRRPATAVLDKCPGMKSHILLG